MDTPARRLDLVFLLKHGSAMHHCLKSMQGSRDHTPVIRLEIMSSASEQEVKSILNKHVYHSVAGYPYCLKLAHNTCKISNEDIDRLASIFGLQNEQGARDPLNE